MDEDTKNENGNSPNAEVQTDTEETVVTDTTEDTQSEEVDVTKLQATNKKLFERAKKAEAELKELKKAPPKQELQEKPQETVEDADSLYENISILKEISSDEMKDLKSEAKVLKVPVVQYIKSKSGQLHLNEIRREKKSKDASEGNSGRSPVYKKYTQEDMSKMSLKDLEKIIPRD